MPDKTISDREAEQLRKKITFINSHGGYRTVMTDAESPCGILPRCTSPDHPADDREQQQDVLDCCETHPLVETWHEHIASVWVDSLTVIPALLDEREQLRAKEAGALEAVAKTVAMLSDTYRERAFLVALLAAKYSSVWAPDEAVGPGWKVVYVGLPTGQASWHISPDDWDLFGFVPQGDVGIWDGHTTVEKYKRVFDLTMNTHLRRMTGGEQ
jgi:hypothetical protein